MPVASTDIVFYAAANKPEDDSSTNGGAIDPDIRIAFTDLAADDDLEVVSDNAADTTQDITVVGRDAAGDVVQETVTLNGTTPVVLSTLGVIQRVLKATLDGDAAGIVTVRRASGGATVATIPAGERGFRRLFINAFSAIGSAKTYYEKIFCKNNHATLSLTSAAIVESADPEAIVAFCLAATKDDSATSTNRVTAPDNADLLDPDTFGNSSQSVPGGSLAAGEAIGLWVRMSLNDTHAPIDSTWSVQGSGTTT